LYLGCRNRAMITKHFFKILFLFTGMIALGLIGVAVLGHFAK